MSPGVSIIICCFNSADRLFPTLSHIAKQKASDTIQWEVILVNNASTDTTVHSATEIWGILNANIPFRIVNEMQQGLIYARQKGFGEASYEFVSFIDDDNWISENWVENVYEIMSNHPAIGACGCFIEPVFEISAPLWFDEVKSAYAVGAQYRQNGFLEFSKRNYIWGAGFTIRKTLYHNLLNCGFKSLLTGRKGNSLSAGEDTELCLAIQMAGYKLFYSDKLRLSHFIPAGRLVFDYCKKINRGFGFSSTITEALEYYISNNEEKKNIFGSWLWSIGSCIKMIFITLLKRQNTNCILKREYIIGRLQALILNGYRQYERNYYFNYRLKKELATQVRNS